MKKLAIILALSSALFAGVVTSTTSKSATGTGIAAIYEQAVDKALSQAVGKLNGAYLVGNVTQASLHTKHNGKSDLKSAFSEKISVATRGRFNNYEIISENQGADGLYHVTVRVTKTSSHKYYKVPGQKTNKNNLVIVKSFDHVDVDRFGKKPLIAAHDLQSALSNEIYKARKFRLLDRDNMAHTDAEESFLKNRASKDEALRLGMSLGADYLLIYEVKRLGLSKGERSKFSGNKSNDELSMIANVRIIVVATKEVKYSTTINFTKGYKKLDGAAYEDFIAEAARRISDELHSGIYPPKIEQMSAGEAIFTQKLPVGSELECFALGKIITDSRTKERTQLETPVGRVQIVRNNEKQSYAKVTSGAVKIGNICRSVNIGSGSGEANSGGEGGFVPSSYGAGF